MSKPTIAQISNELDKISRVDQLSRPNKENTFNAMRTFHNKIKTVINKELLKEFWLNDKKNSRLVDEELDNFRKRESDIYNLLTSITKPSSFIT